MTSPDSSPQSSTRSPAAGNGSGQWDICRFLRTLAYFGAIPVLSSFDWFQRLFDSSPNPRAQQEAIAYGRSSDSANAPAQSHDATELTHPMIFDFRQPDHPLDEIWGPVDDVVMGGVSQSQIVPTAEGALFTGTVSTANSGGFASVRTRNFDPPLDLSAYQGVELRVRGDGKRYKFLLRDESRWDGVGYSASFDTPPDTWTTIQVAFTDLIPVFRARTMQDGQALNTRQIQAVQLMLSKFEYDGVLNPTFEPGEFRLVVEWIRAYR